VAEWESLDYTPTLNHFCFRMEIRMKQFRKTNGEDMSFFSDEHTLASDIRNRVHCTTSRESINRISIVESIICMSQMFFDSKLSLWWWSDAELEIS
jgi:hypothetical protein